MTYFAEIDDISQTTSQEVEAVAEDIAKNVVIDPLEVVRYAS